MSDTIQIQSADSAAFLEFANFESDRFEVVLTEPNFRAASTVYQPDFATLPIDFFLDLARDWEGWKGEKSWGSLEDELTLEATCDSTGHTTLIVKIQRHTHDVWRLQGYLLLEAGQLAKIARDVEKFFARKM